MHYIDLILASHTHTHADKNFTLKVNSCVIMTLILMFKKLLLLLVQIYCSAQRPRFRSFFSIAIRAQLFWRMKSSFVKLNFLRLLSSTIVAKHTEILRDSHHYPENFCFLVPTSIAILFIQLFGVFPRHSVRRFVGIYPMNLLRSIQKEQVT